MMNDMKHISLEKYNIYLWHVDEYGDIYLQFTWWMNPGGNEQLKQSQVTISSGDIWMNMTNLQK